MIKRERLGPAFLLNGKWPTVSREGQAFHKYLSQNATFPWEALHEFDPTIKSGLHRPQYYETHCWCMYGKEHLPHLYSLRRNSNNKNLHDLKKLHTVGTLCSAVVRGLGLNLKNFDPGMGAHEHCCLLT